MEVVLAYIEKDGRYLITKRNAQKNFGGLWEFPGGKVEAGESIKDAVKREIKEELPIEIAVTSIHEPYLFQDKGLDIRFYPVFCHWKGGEVILNEHEDYVFLRWQEIETYDLAPPDYQAVEILKSSNKNK